MIGYTLAALLTTACGWALGRPGFAARVRRTLIVFHLIFIPTQFLFLLAHQSPWAGMALSTATVVGLKPRFPQLKRRARKVWLTLHVGISVGWLGISMAMATLAIAGATSDSHVVRHGSYVLMHLFNLAIVIPSVFVAIISGVVVSLGTPWGLVKHWWVLLKRAALVHHVYAEPIPAYVDGDQDVTAFARVGVEDAVGDQLAGARLDPVQRRMFGAEHVTQEATDLSH